MSWMCTKTSGLKRGKISRKKTVTSEFMKLRCDPSIKKMSPGPRQSKTERSQSSSGCLMTSSHNRSISALGEGSIETSLVESDRSRIARRTTFVENPLPTSIYTAGLHAATNPYSANVSSPPSHLFTQQGSSEVLG